MSDEQNGGPLRAIIASTIAEKMRSVSAEQPPMQPPPVQPEAQPDRPEAQPAVQPVQPPNQPVVQPGQPPVQPVQPVVQPDQPPVQVEQAMVSTAPVADLDVASMFKTPVTDAPVAPPPLPPDTPVQAPPEIEQNEKARSAWEILRTRERESRHRAEALQAQLESVTKQAGSVAAERAKFAEELQGRDDRIHELEDKLGKLDLASRPEFRHQYDDQMQSIAASFRDALQDAAEIDDEAVLDDTTRKLLAVNDAEFTRMVSKLPATAQGSLWDKRREFIGIANARESAIAEWRTAQAGVEKTDEQRRVVENAERRRSLAEQAIDFTVAKLPADRRPSVLSEATYRKDVDSVTEQFRGFMQVASDDELARVAYQGFLVPVMQRQVAYLAEAVGKWREAYYAIRGAGAPPAMPIRVQSEQPSPMPVPAAPKVQDRGGGFSNIVQDTIAGNIQNAMRR